jgi:hypothetical protein
MNHHFRHFASNTFKQSYANSLPNPFLCSRRSAFYASQFAGFSSQSALMQRALARHQLMQITLSMNSSLSLGMVRSQLITNEEQDGEVASQEEGEAEDDDV